VTEWIRRFRLKAGRRTALFIVSGRRNGAWRLLGKSLGTRRFQRAVMGGSPVGGPQRAWSSMRAIASD